MDFFQTYKTQKRSNRELLEKLFVRTYSFLTPESKKIRRLRTIEERAKIIAKEKNIPFPFRCNITSKKGRNFHSIGYSDKSEPLVEGKFNIYIYSSYCMASEVQILATIFHEYGHFLEDRISINALFPLIEIYSKKSFLRIQGDFVEDFCEIFAYRVLELFTIDEEFSKQMDVVLKYAFLKMKEDGVDFNITCIEVITTN